MRNIELYKLKYINKQIPNPIFAINGKEINFQTIFKLQKYIIDNDIDEITIINRTKLGDEKFHFNIIEKDSF